MTDGKDALAVYVCGRLLGKPLFSRETIIRAQETKHMKGINVFLAIIRRWTNTKET
jgi:NhaP-type Na+/H+ and K+/H+ antiporter